MRSLAFALFPITLTAAAGLAQSVAPAPVDSTGNHARPTLAPQHFTDSTSAPSFVSSWQPWGPKGATAKAVAASPTVADLRIVGVNDSFGGGGLYLTTMDGNYWMQVSATGSRGINDVEFTNSGAAFAATQDGLYRSTDNGDNWDVVPVPSGVGQTLATALAADPTDGQTLWLGLGQFLNGTSPTLLLRTTDGGANWEDRSPPVTQGMGAVAVAVDPANAQHVAATFSGQFGFGNELWVTTDGGQNWEERSAGLPNNILWDIAFAPGKLYVCGGQDFGSQFVGLYSSPDDGQNWTEMSADWPSRSVTSVAVTPGNPQKIYVGTQRAGLGVSTDGGQTWTFSQGGTNQFPINDVVFVPGNANKVFLALGAVAVLRSNNGGASFQEAAAGINRLNVSSIAVNPANSNEIAVSYVGDNDGGIFTTTDGGQNWTFDAGAPLPRWQKLLFGANGTLYATHDGPLGRADDGVWVRAGDGTWSNLGPGTVGVLDMQGKSMAVSNDASPVILFGGQEGFLFGYDAAIYTYNRLGTGEWEKSYESGSTQLEEFSGLQWLGTGAGPEAVASMVNFGDNPSAAGGIFRSTDGGASWARSENGYPFGWNAWMITSRPSAPSIIYTSATQYTFSTINNRVFKSIDGGVNWTDQSGFDIPPFRQMIVDPVQANTMYGVNLFNGNVMRSTDDGATFVNFSDGLFGQGGGSSLTYGGSSRRLYYGSTAGAFVTPLEPIGCAADMGVAGGEPGQDGLLDNNDFIAFINFFFNSDARADVGVAGGEPGIDGLFDNNDFIAFINAFFDGCS